MQVVGDHLSDFALSIRGMNPNDGLFARSAFNRFYYAAFLASRQLLVETTGSGAMSHKALPNYLVTTFRQILKRRIQLLFQKNLLSNSARAAMLTALRDNTALLHDLLERAYSVRVLADYAPETPVEIKDATFSLGASTLAEASNWAGRAQMHCKNLRKIWGDLGN